MAHKVIVTGAAGFVGSHICEALLSRDFTVTGIFADLPDNTHMQFEIVTSIAIVPMLMGPNALESWGSNNY